MLISELSLKRKEGIVDGGLISVSLQVNYILHVLTGIPDDNFT